MPHKMNTTKNTTLAPSELVQLIENMSQEKQNKLTRMLCKYTQKKTWTKKNERSPELKNYLYSVYSNKEIRQNPEAERFDDFLKTHTIEDFYLGNSLLFKIDNHSTNHTSTRTEVLKVGTYTEFINESHINNLFAHSPALNTLNLYKKTNIEYNYLNNQIITHYDPNGALIPYNASESESGSESDNDSYSSSDEPPELCSLEVINYIPTDVLTYATQGDIAPDILLKIIIQMALTLMEIGGKGLLFSDAGNKNWLLDDRHNISICDLKSLTEEKYINDLSFCLFSTDGFKPPEIKTQSPIENPIDINSTHAFFLGKNLYQMIEPMKLLFTKKIQRGRGILPGSIIEKNDGDGLNYLSPFFSTEIGNDLKKIICELITPDSSDRLSLEEAYANLLLIQDKLTPENPKPQKNMDDLTTQCETQLKLSPGKSRTSPVIVLSNEGAAEENTSRDSPTKFTTISPIITTKMSPGKRERSPAQLLVTNQRFFACVSPTSPILPEHKYLKKVNTDETQPDLTL